MRSAGWTSSGIRPDPDHRRAEGHGRVARASHVAQACPGSSGVTRPAGDPLLPLDGAACHVRLARVAHRHSMQRVGRSMMSKPETLCRCRGSVLAHRQARHARDLGRTGSGMTPLSNPLPQGRRTPPQRRKRPLRRRRPSPPHRDRGTRRDPVARADGRPAPYRAAFRGGPPEDQAGSQGTSSQVSRARRSGLRHLTDPTRAGDLRARGSPALVVVAAASRQRVTSCRPRRRSPCRRRSTRSRAGTPRHPGTSRIRSSAT